MKPSLRFGTAAPGFVALILCLNGPAILNAADALEAYVKQLDTNYSWKELARTNVGGLSAAHLQLQSQQWREHSWRHNLRIVRPQEVRNPKMAFLFITGSGSGERYLAMLRAIAEQAGVVAAVLMDVPNQPLYDGRKEDALIAYTFQKYMETGDTSWPLLFPMVKSAVRAMDAINEYTSKHHGRQIEKFVIAGASKRGWTHLAHGRG